MASKTWWKQVLSWNLEGGGVISFTTEILVFTWFWDKMEFGSEWSKASIYAVIREEKHDGTTEIKLKGLSQTIMVFKSPVTNMKPKTN